MGCDFEHWQSKKKKKNSLQTHRLCFTDPILGITDLHSEKDSTKMHYQGYIFLYVCYAQFTEKYGYKVPFKKI